MHPLQFSLARKAGRAKPQQPAPPAAGQAAARISPEDPGDEVQQARRESQRMLEAMSPEQVSSPLCSCRLHLPSMA